MSSFGKKGLTKLVWNVGKIDGWLGKSKVTVDVSGKVSITAYGPSKRGKNFAARVHHG